MIEGLLQMSAMGAIVTSAVLLLRLCLRRAPKIFSYALWSIVLFRLLCPVSVALPVSVFNLLGWNRLASVQREVSVSDQLGSRSEPGNGQAVLTESEKQSADKDPGQGKQTNGSHASAQGQPKNQVVSEIPEEKAADGWKRICTAVWLAGVFGMLAYGAYDMVRLRRKIRGASLDCENVYLLEGVASPFVAGIVRPRIYLPYGLSQNEREYVLLHERTHIKRGDPLFRALAYLALALHWFNPLVWVAFFVSCRDMEMSCDEQVLRRMGVEIKREYSNSLLAMAQGGKLVTNISLAFGEGDTGKRIRNVLNYKKATAQVAAVGVLVVALALVALGTNPVERAEAEDIGKDADRNPEEAVQAAGAEEDKGDTLTMDLLCGLVDGGGLTACDFRRYSNGTYIAPTDDSPDYYGVRFFYQSELGDVVLDVSCQKNTGDYMGVLDSIYLTRQWDGEALLIYSRDSKAYYRTGTPPAGEEIQAFLTADFDILHEISFELPDGLSMEPYKADVGGMGGRLFSPNVYEGESHTPLAWMASGVVTRFDADHLLAWEDGQISEVRNYRNHAVITGVTQIFGYTDTPAILVSEEYDLHSPSEMYALDEQGISYEPTSSYWCLYLAKEGASTGYMISLNQKNFTEDDMLALAKTIRLADNASVPKRESSSQQEPAADDTGGAISATISVRSVSRSLPGIDRYVAPDETWEDTYGDALIFADDCKYFINDSRDAMNAHEVNFVKFAEAIGQGDPILNKDCVVEIYNHDHMVHSITLVSGHYQNGVSYAVNTGWVCGDDPVKYPEYTKQYPVVRTETMDIASAPGEENIVIRKGYRKEDGITGVDVDFRDQKNGRLLYSFSASDEGMCQRNVYVGRMDGAGDPYILEVSLENRDTSGVYTYYVFTLGEEPGEIVQTAGSTIEWQKDGPLVYDAGEMDIFLHMLGHYLGNSHLLAGTAWNEDGELEIRTEPVCDEDLFTYANCKPTCFPDPYGGADVR